MSGLDAGGAYAFRVRPFGGDWSYEVSGAAGRTGADAGAPGRARAGTFERNRRVPRLPRPGAQYRVHSVRAPHLCRMRRKNLHNVLERIGAEGR